MTARTLPRRRFALLFAMTTVAAAVAMPAAPALAGIWGNNNIEGNGRIKTETRSVSGFHGVSMSLPGSVEVRIGNTESISIETDDNLLPLIETVVENGTLKIRSNKKNTGFDSKHMKLVVQAKSLDKLALGGSGTITADSLRGPKISVDLGGSGDIAIKNIDTDSLDIDLGGSGELKAANGRANKLSLSIAGSGNVDLGRLQSLSAKASIAGSGDATINVRDALDVSIVGSGNVNYYGDPKLNRSVMGSGSATRMGAAK